LPIWQRKNENAGREELRVKRTIIRVVLWGLLLIAGYFAVSVVRNWDTIQRLFLGGLKVYETEPPALPADIPAANAMFAEFAKANGWGYYQTENGAAFAPEILSRFDAVVFNNVSGDVFTLAQREAFKTWLENGGGYVGIHAAGDNSHQKWGWYMNEVIGTVFTQHTMKPQFQQATVHVEDAAHPATQGLPVSWQRTEEWYSFDKSPRSKGYGVLVTVDEKTYNPEGMFGKDLRMGDHPMVWWHCAGKGRVLYSAFGHRAEAYAEPEYKRLLTSAVAWAARQQGNECGAAAPAAQAEKAP
jgi:type 1 glutamine amidotransferase